MVNVVLIEIKVQRQHADNTRNVKQPQIAAKADILRADAALDSRKLALLGYQFFIRNLTRDRQRNGLDHRRQTVPIRRSDTFPHRQSLFFQYFVH